MRVSFLQDTNALADTVTELQWAGFNPPSLVAFQRAVLRHNRDGIGIELSKFLPGTNGFFTFGSCAAFAQALPNRLWEAKHDCGLSCFDLVIMLLRDAAIKCEIPRDDGSEEGFVVPHRPTEQSGLQPIRVRTLAEAFASVRPSYYTSGVTSTTGLEWTDRHKALTVCLTEYHEFAPSNQTSRPVLAASIMDRRLEAWRKRGFAFPVAARIVQLHVADLAKGLVVTWHCGLLVARKDGSFMYLEKANLRGPFIRIDLQDPTDLLSLAELFFVPPKQGDNVLLFATANAQVLGVVDPLRAFSGRNVKAHEMWRVPALNSQENPLTMHSPDSFLDQKERQQQSQPRPSATQTGRPEGAH